MTVFLGDFRTTITTFQMLCNAIGSLVSQVLPSYCTKSHAFFDVHGGIYSANAFPSSIIHTIQKPPQASADIFCELRDFLSQYLVFPSLVSNAILKNVHKNRVMETAIDNSLWDSPKKSRVRSKYRSVLFKHASSMLNLNDRSVCKQPAKRRCLSKQASWQSRPTNTSTKTHTHTHSETLSSGLRPDPRGTSAERGRHLRSIWGHK